MTDAMWASPDWIAHTLSQPLETEPGSGFAYNDPDAHLLSAIVADVSGQSTLDYARTTLFKPLGIHTDEAYQPRLEADIAASTITTYKQSSVAWPVDPQGYHCTNPITKLQPCNYAAALQTAFKPLRSVGPRDR